MHNALNRLYKPPPTAAHFTKSHAINGLTRSRTPAYDLRRYVEYDEFSKASDRVKKGLEEYLVSKLVRSFDLLGGTSLDIGTATGRWPAFFADRLGFTAYGIDCEPAAVEICHDKHSGRVDLSFAVHDILQDGCFRSGFDVVTAMMGTLSHVASKPTFLERAAESLAPYGIVIVSCWNPACLHCGSLSMYSPREKNDLLRISPTPEEVVEMLHDAGLENAFWIPFAFLSDELYNEPAQEISLNTLVELDQVHRANLPSASAQMFLAVGSFKATTMSSGEELVGC